ncbi:MAG: non-ribosomal peptide synthase/polyketide synthase, partial [Acidobacteriota bacterium]
ASSLLRAPSAAASRCGANETTTGPLCPATPDNLAYVIYTSGSTGRPKGVAIRHSSAVAMVEWAGAAYSREELAGVLAATSICFDLSVFELFAPLAYGGAVILAGNALELALAPGTPGHDEVTMINTVPSAMTELLHLGAVPPSVRTVNLAGEPLPLSLAESLHAAGIARVMNLYGPSEDTTYSTEARIPFGDTRAPAIGRPLPGSRAYVVRGGERTPLGVPAELYLGGAGLARGYLNRPDLTAASFVPDSWSGWSGEPGARLYRTGDRVRYRPDGELEFLGRLDHQVKVRGFRIELGEIEAALLGEPWVRESVVLAREDRAGDRRLVAYVVAAPGVAPADPTAALRARLSVRLPEYMVPADFVVLAELPRTPNGKLDRRALPAPTEVESASGVAGTAAALSPTAELMVGIWSELLGVTAIAPGDDFFALGGHSLLAARLLARVRDVFEVELPLAAVFAAPTLTGMAAAIDRDRKDASFVAPITPERAPADGRIAPLSFGQERLWLVAQLDPESVAYHVPFAARLDGRLDVATFRRALDEIVRRHEVLRTTFPRDAAEELAVQLVAPWAPLPLPAIDLSGLGGTAAGDAESERLLGLLGRQPLDLADGPLVRATLLRLGAERHVALLLQHHIVSDGWSLGVLRHELATLYGAFLGGKPSPLPELPIQYADYAAWQRRRLAAGDFELPLARASARLAEVPEVLDLPTDRPRPEAPTSCGGRCPVRLAPDLGRELRTLARRQGATLHMALLAAFSALLSRAAGQERFAVGTPVAGRGRSELEPLLGFFVNDVALPLDLFGEPSFADLLVRVRASALAAYADQELPFERLVEALRPRDRSRSPLFQTMFVLQNAPLPAVDLPGLALSSFEISTGSSKLDLTLLLADDPATGEGVLGSLEYAADLFDPATAERLAADFARVVEAATADPGMGLAELPLSTPARRQALLGANPRARGATAPPQLPATPMEELLAAIWADLLYRDRVDVEDDFFALGGHSLLAARLISRVRKAVGVEIPLRTLFNAPTVRSQARVILRLQATALGAGIEAPPLLPAPRDRELPLSFAQERLFFLDRYEPESPVYNLAAALDFAGALAPRILAAALSEIVRRHEALRTVFFARDGVPFQIVGEATPLALPVIDLSALEGERPVVAARIERGEARRGFDLGRGPLLRATLLRSGAREWTALLTLHHVAADGWSIEVFLAELSAFYWSLSAGEIPDLPDLPIQYADYAVWQRGWLVGDALDARLAVWRERLRDAPQELDLPADRPRPAIQSLTGGHLPVRLGPGLARAVATTGRSRGTTPFMVLLAAFESLLGLLSGQEEVLVGSPVANRGQEEIEGLIGFFVNTLVLRGNLAGDPSFGALLDRTREVCLEAFAHQDLPFERLVEELKPERDLGRPPLVQALLAYRPAPSSGSSESRGSLSLPGLKTAVRAVPTGTAKLDLTLSLVEEPEGALGGFLEYATALFDPATAARIYQDFELLLGRAVADPDRRLSELLLLSEAQRHQVAAQIDRRALAAADRASPGSPGAEIAPRNPAEELLAGIWAEVLGRDRVGVETRFFDLGGHSLLALRVAARVREAFGADLPLRALFEAPTVAALALRIAEAQGAGGIEPGPPLVRLAESAERPLSLGQERLWFLDRLEPGSSAYNLPFALDLDGPLLVPALAGALSEIVRRHEVLRTTFVPSSTDPERPMQRIAPPVAVPLPGIDLAGLPSAAKDAEAARLGDVAACRPFDLSAGPLCRFVRLRLAADAHRLLANLHHAIFDGGSLGLFLTELRTLYSAAHLGDASPLAEPPLQYADWAAWQRSRLAAPGVLDGPAAWWRERLAGANALDLPLDAPRPPVQSFAGGTVALALAEEPTRALAALARRLGATPFMVLLAAFEALLGRLSGQEDLTVGTPFANRGRPEVEGLIGFFVETLVLRGDLAGDPRFAELAARAREAVLGAHAHGDLPFERLVEELRPARDLARPPLFQAMLAFQDGLPAFDLDGLAASVAPLSSGSAKFELTLGLAAVGAGLVGGLEYASRLFDRTTVARWTRSFTTLLFGALAEPDRRLSELPLLSGTERHQLEVEWNAPGPEPAGEADETLGLHQLFEAQAARTPGAIALVAGHERLTYAELDERAALVARRLRAQGVVPEVCVGVSLARDADLVVALLGVLKAGGAYVPIDPAYPEERREVMVADSGAGLLLDKTWLDRNIEPVAPAPEAPALFGEGATAGNLAYVIFTSGSTGRPKGVAIEHRSASALVAWARRTYSDEELAGVLAATSIAFDLSVFELFVTLACGGSVILAANALELPELPAAREVTLINTVPSAMAELVRMGGIPPSVRTVNLAGEPLSRALVDGVYAAAGVERVCNAYGPSEDTTYSTFVHVPRGERRAPTIGRPLPGTAAYLVDRGLRPTTIGVPGELLLGGLGLARGYLGRPELTAERFIPNPFGAVEGGRLYRTGDLARFLPDGQIEFLGRIDHQVKVRGFRIELGEIEVVLREHPALADLAVVAREDGNGDRALAAYVVVREGAAPPAADDLRAHLRRRLPEYMVPADFVVLAELPRTPNGKLNRKALPAPERGRSALAHGFRAPRTPDEELLAGIWADLLKVPRVGVEDDFFALGGHSLLSTRLVARVRDVFGVELPLRALFEAPTVAALAARIASIEGGSPDLPPLLPRPEGDAFDLPLSFAQERLWFLDRLEPGSAAYNLPVALYLRGELDVPRFARALAGVARRHEALRTRFRDSGTGPMQEIEAEAEIPFVETDLRLLPESARGAEATRLLSAEARMPFDLARGPLARARLLRLDEGLHLALLTLHHIAADGWSFGVLLSEIAALYGGAVLPPLTIQYADYALWQRRWFEGPVLEAQLAYWSERLEGAPVELELPADRARPAPPTGRGGVLPLVLDGTAWDGLRAVCRRLGATPYMGLLAAFQSLLGRLAGEEDVLVGTAVANRRHSATEGLIGVFVNTLVLRTSLAGDPVFARLVERARETALGAFAHQDLPFERLVEELHPDRDLARPPLFQVLLVLHNEPLPVLELPGLTLEPIEVATGTAKLDLTLALTERGERQDGVTGGLEYSCDRFDAATAGRIARAFEAWIAAAAENPRRRLSELPLLAAEELLQLGVPQGERPERRLLRARGSAVSGIAAYRAPLSPLEEGLADLWSELLGADPIGRDDDFFRLGGHSLLAARMVARLRDAFGVDLPLRAVFAAPTVAALAARIATMREGGAADALPLVARSEGAEIELPLSFAQERLWFLDRLEPGSPVYNLPVGLRLSGELDVPRFARALSGVVRRHEPLRTRFRDSGAGPVQEIDAEQAISLGCTDLRLLPEATRGQEVARLLAAEARLPFDLARGPLLRARLLRLEDGLHLALLSLHHIAADGWSFGVLLSEVAAHYGGATLPPLPIQYADYALWQRRGLAGPMLEAQLAWWSERLGGAPTELELPADRQWPAVPSRRGGVRPFGLGPEEWDRLRALCRRRGATPFMGLLAALQAFLGRLADEEEVLVGTAVANRRHSATEGLIGLFVNTLVLRTSLVGDPPFERLVERARETALGAYAHQDLPFERLVEELAAERDLAGSPLFQVLLVLHNAPLPVLDLPGLTLTPIEIETGTAKLDLTLSLTEREESVEGGLEYSADRFDATTAERFARAFEVWVAAAAESPRRRLSELPLLAAEELLQLVVPPAGRPERRLLRARGSLLSGAVAYRAPLSPLEEGLADLWTELLGADRIGRDDDFFHLGGHSLLAARLVARVRETYAIELPVRAVFEAPTLAALAARTQRMIAAAPGASPPIARRAADAPVRASFAQERIWFLDRFAPGDSSYNIPVALRLLGALDPRRFALAFERVVERQEALRTAFREREGQVVLEISPRAELPVGRVDLAALPAAATGTETKRLLRTEASRPFDLARSPLARIVLLHLPSEHLAILTLHHIVADGWSIGVLLREVGAFYAAGEGEEPALPALPIQYADFAAWQRDWLEGEALAGQLVWWREALHGSVHGVVGPPPALTLPTDRPRPAVANSCGRSLPVEIGEPLTRALAALGRRHGATLFMTLLAAYEVLLSRLSGQERLVVGSPVASRSRVETEGLIGLFLSTLPLPADLGRDPRFSALLAQVRETTLGAYAHQDLPFEKLVAELAPERNLAHAPIFQVLLVLQNTPLPKLDLPGLVLEGVEVESDSAKLDLVLNVQESADRGLAGRFLYKTDLFDRATVSRFAGHLNTLIAGLEANPERRISELPLLSPAEQQQLQDWNATATTYRERVCLHELIEEQAARTPDAVAVTSAGAPLSYRRLDRAANALARRLVELGVGPEARVGIVAERSLELSVGLLAILKAGGAYVPLDPSYPEERLAWMLEDSRVGVLLAQERLVAALPAHGARVVLLDGCLEEEGEALPPRGTDPDNLAYVIYTSGSTGRPKGAMNSHRAIVNRLLWMQERYSLGPADRVLQKTPVSFDVSVWELFWPLLAGARLVMAEPGRHGDSAYLVETIEAERITTLHFVPSMLQVFVSAPGVERCGSVVRVIASGEALSRDLQDRFLARSGAALDNLYGPTEAAVDVTWWACEHGSRSTVPIGRPVANTTIHLLDRTLRPVPVGVSGELFIGGVQVGRGYWRRPELTAERFVPDPFSAEPGARLYRTGDLARYATDAAIEYLGRLDHQVKIRGFRIELGEIEAVLTDQSGVAEAVVLALAAASAGGAEGDRRLVAYVTPVDLSVAALSAALRALLPDHMVPSAFVRLVSLPLSPSGKADRAALAKLPLEPSLAEAGAGGREHVAPRTALESDLVDLWHEAVGAEKVGIHDPFFALGGSSISGAILINRVQERLGEIVHVVAIFDHPTVAGLAAYLARDYPKAVAAVWGAESLVSTAEKPVAPVERVDEAKSELLRRIVTPVSWHPAAVKNPPALFVLSPPRSGSTLLRVMLAGHPRLFAPPELELLTFGDMAERKAAFSGRESFWLEGLLRAVMEVRQCGPEEAAEILAAAEAEALPTQVLTRRLQGWLGDRLLVDKTPSYALDPALLARIEQSFEEPRYLHLTRHPYGMIRSFEEARLEQVFFRHRHPFSRRELAELVWLASHDNVERFLAGVPEERHHRLRFEDLVRDPARELAAICAFLGLDYHPEMADPYGDARARMTDGPYEESRMLGDVKFHRHARVDAAVAERWREELNENFLGDPARVLAARLGYEVESVEPVESLEPARVALGPIPRLPRRPDEPTALSFAQERLWFLDQLDPHNAAYNIPAAFLLKGELSVPLLKASAAEIARRHETLRTSFAERDGRPVSLVAPPGPASLPQVELSGLNVEVRRKEAARLARQEAARPFDLAAGPLVRLGLLRLTEAEWTVLLALHHVVADGWSLGVYIREMAALYTAFVAGEPSPLPEPPIQYADYAAWQRSRLIGPALDAQISWWREQLASPENAAAPTAPDVLDLPTDRPRAPVQSLVGAERGFALSPALSQRLRDLSRREDVTLFMAVLAAFQALLGRHSGQERVLVGSPVANRNRAETEGLIGLFVNTLVFNGDLAGTPSFRDLLARTRGKSIGAFAHAEVPFERLVDALVERRDPSRPPLFQVMLAYQNAPAGAAALPGLTLSAEAVASGTSKFELTLAVAEVGEGESWHLAGTLDYSAGLFDTATAARLLSRFEVLLGEAVADPERSLQELSLLSPVERHQTRFEWPAGDPYEDGDGACLHELVEAQVQRTPDALALVAGADQLSYRDLDERADRLALRLRELGAGPERRVAVCLDRSAELVVALLAVLKAGSAYVPLDPAYPQERRQFVLEDSGAALRIGRGLEVSSVGPDAPLSNPGNSGPDHLAYVIYTSGSTGVPKGVAITHGNAVAFVRWAGAVFSIAELSGVLAATSISFDLSIFELFVPLSRGGTVILADDALALPSAAEAARAAGVEITLVNTVPSAIAELVRLAALPASVRTVSLAGEPLQRGLVDRVYAQPGVARVLNLYGPSEDTTYSTFARVAAGPGGAPTIGRPVGGTRAYVLDGDFKPVPAGLPGELYLGGAGLARGYLDRPGATAERFVPDPFGGSAGGGTRLYRTGDLARWRPEGDLEFLGRRDFQVKIRGFRIELGEIEAALAEHPAVAEAAVLARPEEDGGLRLVAYVAPQGAGDLRDYLAARLPAHMLPSAFVGLPALPLTANGKIDRRALAKLAVGTEPGEGGGATGRLPSTPEEELVAGIWSEVLGLGSVGATDDFFHLGGHSLLATRVVSRLRQAFAIELPVRALFAFPTVAALAAEVARVRVAGEPDELEAPPILPVPRGERIPLSFAQERIWFLDQLEPDSATFNLSATVRLAGRLQRPLFDRALSEVVRRHETLRTTFRLSGAEPVQVIAPAVLLVCPVVDLAALPAETRRREASRRIAEEVARPFDLARGPLLRATLLRLGDQEHTGLLTVHHVISDGWSQGLLLEELATLYGAFARGEASPLPEPAIQYADYGVWQRAWLHGPVLDRQLGYWRGRLTGAPPRLDLPTDRPRPTVQTFRVGQRSVRLTPNLSSALRALSRRQGATLFMTLLAAFDLLLSRHSGQEDLVVGTPIAGRGRIETEKLIGLFLNTLALRTDLSGSPSFADLVARVRETALGAYGHQDVPFEKILDDLRPSRDLGRTPLFQVFFNLLNLPNVKVELPGLALEAVPAPALGAKFDLTLYAAEHDGGLGFEWVYNADLFDPARIEILSAQWESLLDQAVAAPERSIDDFSLRLEADRAILPDPTLPLPAGWPGSVVARFAEHAKLAPERPAILSDERNWTYGELDAASRRIAGRLRNDGIGAGDLVAIYARRSGFLVEAMLGTWRAGAAFLILDAAYPPTRLADCLNQARPRALIEVAVLPAALESEVAGLSLRCRIAPESNPAVGDPAPDVVNGPDDLAYVAFTSGSTGKPKGILGTHRPVSHFLTWHTETFHLGREDRFSLLAGLSHDPLLRDVFTPLWLGATLCVPGADEMREPGLLLAWLARQKVTAIHLTPALGQLLASATPEREPEVAPVLSLLRWAFYGGGALSGGDVARLARLAPEATAVNFYGATETPQAMAWNEVAADAGEGRVPLGRGIDGVQILVLSRAGQLVGRGERGEICVRTPYLAQGYLGDPEATADRFIVNPATRLLSGNPADRIYRTGDLGRYLLDGTVEFLGRADEQVNVRGYRVELGEIEAALSCHPGIRETVVLACE